jgi:hypothetical protein
MRNNLAECKFFCKYSEKHMNALMNRILRRIKDPKCRDDGAISELVFYKELELIKPKTAQKEDKKELIFRKTKFKGGIPFVREHKKEERKEEIMEEKAEEKKEEVKEEKKIS